MDLTLSDELEMLAEVLASFVSREVTVQAVQVAERSHAGFLAEQWAALAGIGVPALMVPSELGGAGKGALELAVAAKHLGAGAVPGPLISSAVLSTALLAAAAPRSLAEHWLPRLADGRSTASVALLEPGSRHEWETPRTRLSVDGAAVRVSGTKVLVPYAGAADLLIVVGTSDRGLAAVALDREEAGFGLRRQSDGGGDAVYEVSFDDTRAPSDSMLDGDVFVTAFERSLQAAAIVSTAYAVGGAQRSLELATKHASERVQFGRPIGSFQAVSHRCVDMHCDIQATEYLCWRAAAAWDSGDAWYECSAAKAFATEAMQRVYRNAHQVLGAIGYSMEHELQLHSRRSKVFELSYGGTDFHYDRVANAKDQG